MSNAFDKRRAATDIYGKTHERISEYFDFQRFPEKATYRVTRNELLAVITQIERAKQARTWRGLVARLWRFLKRPLGSKLTDETGVESPEVNRR